MFLEGRRHDLIESLESRMMEASEGERFEQAASYRDLLRTLSEIEERQKIAAAQGDDIDVLAWHAEPPLVAVNLFHLRGGRVVDRRDFYWEDLAEFDPPEFLSSLLKQLYLDAAYLPRAVHVPLDFESRETLEAMLTERAVHLEPPRSRVEILVPQRGAKHAFLELVEKNARHSFEQRFRVMKPGSKAIVEALEQALDLPEAPRRIESFDISHLQGSDTVASMVVWEDGQMKKSDYRKFIIRGEWGNDDFASMKETVERRYRRLQEEKKPFPSLILIDGGLGQLHAAAAALEKLEVINQPVASIAKQEEIIYVLGQENHPIRLEHHSPILHLIQQIRDETHRFAVGFHRQRRTKRTIQTGLENIPGVGPRTAQKLLRRFGSVAQIRSASVEQIAKVVPRGLAERVSERLAGSGDSALHNQ
jgi:excinuclease ABC subunit C